MDALIGSVDGASLYASRPAVAEDLAFMRGDNGVRDLMSVLARFGNAGRYCRLDHMVSEKRKGADGEPSRRWEEIEQELVWARPDRDEILESMDLLPAVTFEVRRCFQRLARAIARMWTLGALGEGARVHYGVLSIFVGLAEEELGRSLGTG